MGGNFTLNVSDVWDDEYFSDEKKEELNQFSAHSDGFLVLIRTNHSKIIGFFVPSNFKNKSYEKTSNPLLAFYWINNNSNLVTSKRMNQPIFE